MKIRAVLNFFAVLFVIQACGAAVFSQDKPNVEKIVETEKSFARFSDEKGIKPAFLEFLTDDALLFAPAQTNGKDYWRARPDNSPATLIWYPIFADVASNGALAYTTGRGECRAKGRSDTTVYYSDFLTVWRRQPDGAYKAALDVGVNHDQPPVEDKNWTSPPASGVIADGTKSFAADSINKFFDTVTTKGLEKSYKTFAAKDARFLREGKPPILGAEAALREIRGKSKISFGKQMTLQSAGDLAYVVTTCEMKTGGKITEKGNLIQVWKLMESRWQIVADVFAPMPTGAK